MKSIDPSEIRVIEYLSGEMTREEVVQFEKDLKENPLLEQQLDELRATKSQLQLWGNEDIPIPDFHPGKTQNGGGSSIQSISGKRRFPFPQWVKYAASFLGFVLLLNVLGVKLTHKENTLMLSFGDPAIDNVDQRTVDEIVNKALDNYSKSQLSQFATFKSQLDDLNTAVNSIALDNKSNIHTLEGAFNRSLDQQYMMIKSIEDNQRQDLEDSFTGLIEYVENNRIQDQYKIQNAFSEIATAINNQQSQTNALLTSISDEKPGLKSY